MKAPKVLATALVAVVFAVLAVGNAYGASQSATFNLSGSGPTVTLLHGEGFCDPCFPDDLPGAPSGNDYIGAIVDVTVQTSWTAAAPTAVNYSQGNLKQGSTLDASDVLTEGAGTINVTYSASLTLGAFNGTCPATPGNPCSDLGSFTISKSISDTAPCAIALSGESPRNCPHTTNFPLGSFTIFDVIKLSVSIDLTTTFSVSGNGVVTVRKAVISGGVPIADNPLTFNGTSPSTKADPIFIDCAQPVGSDLNYSFTGISYTASSVNVTESAGLRLKVDIDIPLIPTFNVFDAVLYTVSAPSVQTGPISMTGLDQTLDLGPVLANTTPPSVGLNNIPQNGVEGSAIAFSVKGTGPGGSFSNCDASGNSLDYAWSFDDGGAAFGKSTNHVFVDNNGAAPHSGKVVVTDKTGLATTLNFSVSVANVKPTVSLGLPKITDWGLSVAFHANTHDDGLIDNANLLVNWDFHDPANPNGATGPDVTHTFANASVYNVEVKVTDKDGAVSDSAFVPVTVNKRGTSIAYTGPTQGMPNSWVTLSAQVTDNHGQAVAGGIVTFTLGSGSTAQTVTGTTSGSGGATASLRINQKPPGAFPLSVSMAEDAHYTGSAANLSFTVGQGGGPH